jgi:hypothetical protein
MPTTTPTPARVLVDARTMPVTITTLSPRPGPVPVAAPLRVPAVRVDRRPARAVDTVPAPVGRRAAPVALGAALTVATLAAVAGAGLYAGHARLGLGLLAAVGRVAVVVAVVAAAGCLARSAGRGHCPGCPGVRR